MLLSNSINGAPGLNDIIIECYAENRHGP